MTNVCRLAGFCLFFVLVAVNGGRAQTVRPIFENGETARRLNVVLIAEGYRESELADFRAKAGQIVNHLFSEEPFLGYKQFFNAYTLSIPSSESGADEPADDKFVDTAFDAKFDADIDRLLTVNSSKVTNALLEHFPEYDVVLVVVNSSRYGGSGGVFAVTSINRDSFEIAVHELGHSFGGLEDEYEYEGSSNARESPNVTAETDRGLVKWRDWFEDGTPVPTPENSDYGSVVGLFEGAMYKASGWYRPHYDSKMRSLGRPWGQVNAEQLVLRMYVDLPFFTAATPSGDTVFIDDDFPVAFALEEPLPDSAGSHVYLWRIDGEIVSDEGPTFALDPRLLANGSYRLEVEVRDATDLVRSDADGLLSESRGWDLEVAVVGEPKLYAAWAEAAIPDAELRSRALDIDGDGYRNIEEFFLGSDPLEENGEAHSVAFGFEAGSLLVEVRREPLRRLVEAKVQAAWLGGEWETIGLIKDDVATVSEGTTLIADEDFRSIRIMDAPHLEESQSRQSRLIRVRFEAD